MLTIEKLSELYKKAATPVPCGWCLGKGYHETHEEERDPKCNYCQDGKVPLDADMLDLIEELFILREIVSNSPKGT